MEIEYLNQDLKEVEKNFAYILMSKTICLDFYRALKEQKVKHNLFINWVFLNYQDIITLDLCKILEEKKKHYSLTNFIKNLIKNYDSFTKTIREFNNKLSNFKIEEIKKNFPNVDNYDPKIPEFNIPLSDIEYDLEQIKNIHSRLIKYRNKKLCHNDISKEYKDVSSEKIKTLHSYIDKIESIIIKYLRIFNIYMDYDILKKENYYNNFKFELK